MSSLFFFLLLPRRLFNDVSRPLARVVTSLGV